MDMKRRVLLVDDDEMILAFLQAFAENRGYEVLLAHNGMEALEILTTERVVLIITDVVMPRMDGMALATRVKEMYPGTFIVGVSGQMALLPEEGIPFDVFFGKPFDLHRLKEILPDEHA